MKFLLLSLLPALLLTTGMQAKSAPISTEENESFKQAPQMHDLVSFTVANPTHFRISLHYKDLVYNFEPNETKSLSLPVTSGGSEKIALHFMVIVENESQGTSSGAYLVDAARLYHGDMKAHFKTEMVYPGAELWTPVDAFVVASLVFDS